MSRHLFLLARQKSRSAAYLVGCPQRSTTIITLSDGLTSEVTCITAASIRVPWPDGRFPSVQGGADPTSGYFEWPGPVVLIFVTTNFEPGTNLLTETRGGRVVASVGNPSLETSLPFGRRDLRLLRSGSAAVVGIDAVGGTPDGDFTKEGGGRVAARRCPYGLFAIVVGGVSDLICEAGHQLRPLRQVLAANLMIMKR